MGCSDMGAGSHHSDMGGHRYKDPGRGGPSSARSHIDDDRYSGGHDFFDDEPHRLHQASRGVELDNEALSPFLSGLIDRFSTYFGGGWVNDPVHFNDINRSLLLGIDGDSCG